MYACMRPLRGKRRRLIWSLDFSLEILDKRKIPTPHVIYKVIIKLPPHQNANPHAFPTQ